MKNQIDLLRELVAEREDLVEEFEKTVNSFALMISNYLAFKAKEMASVEELC